MFFQNFRGRGKRRSFVHHTKPQQAANQKFTAFVLVILLIAVSYSVHGTCLVLLSSNISISLHKITAHNRFFQQDYGFRDPFLSKYLRTPVS